MDNTDKQKQTKRKAKRNLSDISFDHDTAHIAMTSKTLNGGPANGADYVVLLKAQFSQEYIEKIQEVKVTLSTPEFLEKFFDVYGAKAEVLARMMGYVPESKNTESMDYEDYIQSQLQSFEVMKAVKESDNVIKSMLGLTESDYLALLEDQAVVEKAFELIEKEHADAVNSDKQVASTEKSVEKSVEPTGSLENKTEKSMTQEVQEVSGSVETVEKSVFEGIQKAFDEQKVMLEKALETIAQFEAEKKQAIVKAKTDQIQAIVKDEAKAQILTKASLSLESEDDFTAFVGAIQAMMTTVETSDMFVEKGVTAQDEAIDNESGLVKLMKARHAKAK